MSEIPDDSKKRPTKAQRAARREADKLLSHVGGGAAYYAFSDAERGEFVKAALRHATPEHPLSIPEALNDDAVMTDFLDGVADLESSFTRSPEACARFKDWFAGMEADGLTRTAFAEYLRISRPTLNKRIEDPATMRRSEELLLAAFMSALYGNDAPYLELVGTRAEWDAERERRARASMLAAIGEALDELPLEQAEQETRRFLASLDALTGAGPSS